MQFKQMYVRLEIAFWETTIPLLEESDRLQRLLCQFHSLYGRQAWISRLPAPVVWIGAGLSLGFLIGILAALITP